MKPIYLLSCILVLTVGLIAGCKTSQIQTAIKTEGVLITTVDTGMSIWADYVRAHQFDGKVKQSQVDAVRQAYEAYYAAQMTAKATIEKVLANVSTNSLDIATANAAVEVAKNQLLSLLNEYIK